MNQKTIRNLRIENFQSHELTEMAFDDGLNVIVGASDHGKSAVIRALRWLLYNEPRGSDFMRVGANAVRVTIELADGSRVTRERTPSKNRYIVAPVDGEEQIYEGFGNSVPKEVSDITGVAKVMLDEDHETALHLGTQLEPAFLLSEPGSIKAKAIGRLNGVHIIDAASRDTHRDTTRLTAEEKGLREQLADVEAELDQFADVAYLENILLIVEEKQAQLKQLQGRRERLHKLHAQYRELKQDLAATEQVLSLTEQLDRADLQTERAVLLQGKAVRLHQAFQKVQQVEHGLQQTQRILQHTEGLERATEGVAQGETKLGALRRLSRLSTARSQVEQAQAQVDRVMAQTAGLSAWEASVERLAFSRQRLLQLQHLKGKNQAVTQTLGQIDRVLQQTSHVPQGEQRLEQLTHKRSQAVLLHDLQTKKNEAERLLQRLQKGLNALARTEQAEWQLQRLIDLSARQKRLIDVHLQLSNLSERLKNADIYLQTNALELTEMLDRYSDELKRSGTCPVCFTPIDEHTTERLLEEYRGGISR